MNTIEATVSMMETMPEEKRLEVMKYTHKLYISKNFNNPFKPLTKEQILADLAESRQQIAEGKVMSADEVLKEIGNEYGFI